MPCDTGRVGSPHANVLCMGPARPKSPPHGKGRTELDVK